MSKPGGKPIVKKRPFFEDDNIAIYSLAEGGKFTAFEGVDKANKVTKTFTVNKKQEVKKAWQELEKFLGPIVEKILKDDLRRLRFKPRFRIKKNSSELLTAVKSRARKK